MSTYNKLLDEQKKLKANMKKLQLDLDNKQLQLEQVVGRAVLLYLEDKALELEKEKHTLNLKFKDRKFLHTEFPEVAKQLGISKPKSKSKKAKVDLPIEDDGLTESDMDFKDQIDLTWRGK